MERKPKEKEDRRSELGEGLREGVWKVSGSREAEVRKMRELLR